MDPTPLVLVLAVVAVVALLRFLSRPHTVIRIAGGRATLVRGTVPPGLLGELGQLASDAPSLEGNVRLSGGGDRLEIDTPGLDPAAAQRVHNVLHPWRERIR